MNQIESLKVFCSAAETGQFAETAQRLNISPQSVSRIIGELEQTLGERLFQRSTRQIRLTDFGAQFLPEAHDLLKQAEKLFAKPSKQDTPSGKVRITLPDLGDCTPLIGAVLHKLQDYPDITLDWQWDTQVLNAVEHGIDIGVRIGELPDSRLVAKTICAIDAGIYAAPSLIARLGQPIDFADFARRYPQGIFQTVHNGKSGRVWQWILPDGSNYLPQQPKISCNDLAQLANAAISGHIAAALPSFCIRPQLANGKLVPLFPEFQNISHLHLYRTPHQILPQRIKLVFDAMFEALWEMYGARGN